MKTTTQIKKNPSAKTFLDHLDELRGKLLISFIAFVGFSVIFSFFTDPFLKHMTKPVGQLIYTSPADAFFAQIMIALLGGFILTLPILLFQVWSFVAEGLKENESRYVLAYAPASAVLFVLGGAFAYFITIPFALKFLLGFSNDYIVPMITVNSYVSFIVTLVLAFGVVFELPLVLMFLTKIGIATPAFLTQKRRHAFIIILIVSAVITPPDVVTQIIMAGPLMVLYEIGILVSKMVYREKMLRENMP
ncbi:MAG: twin-arginine translocase subunit TatC [Candidatus Omnitrophica bacterium]|nr:twin-arginine translocase subunit TatC [Candidatus Omnitrophota bacterium]